MTLFERLSSDAAFLRGMVRLLGRSIPIAKHPQVTLGDMVEALAEKFGDRVALVSDRETFTYRQWNGRANRYARWALSLGLGKGDTLCLLMPNRAEYLPIWMGIARSGAATALLNTNLHGESLAHSIRIVNSGIVIVEAAMLSQLEGALRLVDRPVRVFVHGSNERHPRIDIAIDGLSEDALPADLRPKLTIEDPCIYVFTSGTTGLPKAANLNHYRVQLAMKAFSAFAGSTRNDRMYDCLPMYHTNGGVLAPGSVLTVGGTCVIRDRFSSREFWPDVIRHRCTMFMYIGELCRYLLRLPPAPDDRAHGIRVCVGNGLRPDVWVPFRDRFGIGKIREFYASTEGNCSMFNFDSRPEAVGRIPRWIASRFPIRVIRFDVRSEEALRGPDGLCIECVPDEVGEVVGEIVADPAKPGSRFEGYTDRQATERKILRNVVRPGDSWFRTGDLMRRDRLGYFYFVDRVGDTFRWKGENVATSQVSETLTGFTGVMEAAVYGVTVPGTEGRAGMASILVEDRESFDVDAFKSFVDDSLPVYAVPVFIHLARRLAVTGTFKQRKIELVMAGFDPAKSDGPLFFQDPATRRYRPLDADVFLSINAGELRL